MRKLTDIQRKIPGASKQLQRYLDKVDEMRQACSVKVLTDKEADNLLKELDLIWHSLSRSEQKKLSDFYSGKDLEL